MYPWILEVKHLSFPKMKSPSKLILPHSNWPRTALYPQSLVLMTLNLLWQWKREREGTGKDDVCQKKKFTSVWKQATNLEIFHPNTLSTRDNLALYKTLIGNRTSLHAMYTHKNEIPTYTGNLVLSKARPFFQIDSNYGFLQFFGHPL